MQRCLGRMMDAVHRYKGTITHFLGDSVMALFSAPITHEDSACRAFREALAVIDGVGAGLQDEPLREMFLNSLQKRELRLKEADDIASSA